jgi:hypothetical protein
MDELPFKIVKMLGPRGPSNSAEAKKKKPRWGISRADWPAGLSDDDAESPLADKRGLIGASRMKLKRKSPGLWPGLRA